MDHVRLNEASAPAKFLLAGEYSVLLEGPALAIPLPELRLSYRESAPATTETPTRVFLNNEEIHDEGRLAKVLALRQIIAPRARASAEIHVTTRIPIGKGLGSSAALSVAMARYHVTSPSNTQIAEIALEGEKLFHGNPSGVDPYCVSFEKPIAYVREPRSAQPLAMHDLKKSGLVFLLRDSGGEHSTRTQLQMAMSKETLIRELASEARKMLEAVDRDAKQIAPCMHRIQSKLSDLGASSPAIEANIAELYSLGAQGAKITGSGRGGFVIAVFDSGDFAKLPSTVLSRAFSWRPA
ncbi:MAG TPA: hypothetical protein VM901_01170 [Bdellovibrionota bacterium]|jgi:mevalonate kinase|nr:hypothetical protein [Bdellovibrionota bacterium]